MDIAQPRGVRVTRNPACLEDGRVGHQLPAVAIPILQGPAVRLVGDREGQQAAIVVGEIVRAVRRQRRRSLQIIFAGRIVGIGEAQLIGGDVECIAFVEAVVGRADRGRCIIHRLDIEAELRDPGIGLEATHPIGLEHPGRGAQRHAAAEILAAVVNEANGATVQIRLGERVVGVEGDPVSVEQLLQLAVPVGEVTAVEGEDGVDDLRRVHAGGRIVHARAGAGAVGQHHRAAFDQHPMGFAERADHPGLVGAGIAGGRSRRIGIQHGQTVAKASGGRARTQVDDEVEIAQRGRLVRPGIDAAGPLELLAGRLPVHRNGVVDDLEGEGVGIGEAGRAELVVEDQPRVDIGEGEGGAVGQPGIDPADGPDEPALIEPALVDDPEGDAFRRRIRVGGTQHRRSELDDVVLRHGGGQGARVHPDRLVAQRADVQNDGRRIGQRGTGPAPAVCHGNVEAVARGPAVHVDAVVAIGQAGAVGIGEH